MNRIWVCHVARISHFQSVHLFLPSGSLDNALFSVTRVESMCSNCLTTTLPVECVCSSWSSLNASPYPGATVSIISVSEQN